MPVKVLSMIKIGELSGTRTIYAAKKLGISILVV